MIVVLLIPNPFEPFKHTSSVFENGLTPNAWLRDHDTSEAEKRGPLMCLKNKVPLLREEWDTPLEDGDSITFLPVVNWEQIIIAIVVAIISVVVSLALTPSQKSTPDMPSQGDIKEADPVFTLRGQENKNKISMPIERIYGRVRHWPSYGAAPYTRYIDNDSWLYSVFCLGQGKVQIHQLYIEDTPIENFQFVEYEVVQPGATATLFPDDVYSSTEVANIELFGANQASYTGYSGGFVALPPLGRTKLIECDLLLPRGLYYSNDTGTMDERTVSVVFETRRIDDADNPMAPWTIQNTFTRTAATNTPLRYTVSMIVDEGRYEVRARRTNDADTSHRAADTIVWSVLRAFLPALQVYPGVTMLFVRAKATNNLNDNVANRINFSGTARIPVWTPEGGWLEDVPTRSAVWAFCDVFCSRYGGNLDRSFLDVESLHALDQELTTEGIYFDWVCENKSTTWDIAKTIATVCRATPLLTGSRIGLVRERPQVLPVMVFSENNIQANTLSIGVKLRDVNDHDGLEIEYINPVTWQPETVLCLAPDDAGENLKTVKLPGCTDRTKAYRAGMYMRMSELRLRASIKWKTGMEGFLPTYGDLVAISHKFPRWGKMNGLVREIDGTDVFLDRDVTFVEDQTHYLLIRKRDGSVYGPSVATQVNERTVRLAAPLPDSFFMPYGEPPVFLFGYGTQWGKLVRIVNLRPEGDETVEVEATNYDPGIFAYDETVPPPLNPGYYIPIEESTPQVTGLEVRRHPTDDALISITWLEVLGSVKYVVQSSTNGADFTTVAEPTAPYYFLPVLPGQLWLRVFAIRTGAGPAATWHGLVGIPLPLPGNVSGAVEVGSFTGLMASVSWNELSGIDGYQLRVFTKPVSGSYKLARTVQVEHPPFNYFYSDAVQDNAVDRVVRFLITGMNITGESAAAAEVITTNPLPVKAEGLTWVNLDGNPVNRLYRLTWIGDSSGDVAFFRIKVKLLPWEYRTYTREMLAGVASTSEVESGYIIYEGSALTTDVWMPTLQTAYNFPNYAMAGHWLRIYTVDKWGTESIASDLYMFVEGIPNDYVPIAP